MNRQTGGALSETAHIGQSIADILTTPLGSRIQRREYGSLVPDLVDAPGNRQTLILIYAAIATALLRWEPRISLQRVQLHELTAAGTAVLDIEAIRLDVNQALNLSVPLKLGAAA